MWGVIYHTDIYIIFVDIAVYIYRYRKFGKEYTPLVRYHTLLTWKPTDYLLLLLR